MTKPTPEIADDEFDINALDAADAAEMRVVAGGRPTSWVWTFAGPGHPQTIAKGDKRAREILHTQALQEQARVNGKKWTAPEASPEEKRREHADIIVDRLLGWSDVKFGGELYPFTPDNARALLVDPKKIDLARQALDFLGSETSFTNRSAKA